MIESVTGTLGEMVCFIKKILFQEFTEQKMISFGFLNVFSLWM